MNKNKKVMMGRVEKGLQTYRARGVRILPEMSETETPKWRM